MPINPFVAGSLISGGATLAGGLLGMFGQSSANSSQYNNWLKSYRRQRADALADRQYNEWLMRNSALIERESKLRAGINPAMGNGNIQTISNPTNNVSGNDFGNYNPFAGFQAGLANLSQNMMIASQIKNTDANTKKTEADTNKTVTDTEKVRLEIDQFKKTFDTVVDTAKQNLNNLKLQGQLTDEQIKKTSKEIDALQVSMNLTDEQIKRIKDMTPVEISQMKANIVGILSGASLNKQQAYGVALENQLKGIGIYPGADWLTNFIMMSKKGEVGNILTGLISGVVDGIVKLYNKVKDAYDDSPLKGPHVVARARDDFFGTNQPYRSYYVNNSGRVTIYDWKYNYDKKKYVPTKARKQYQDNVRLKGDPYRWNLRNGRLICVSPGIVYGKTFSQIYPKRKAKGYYAKD